MLDFTLERARAYLADVITKIINGHPERPRPAVGLSHHPSTQVCGLKTALTTFR